MEIHPKVLVAFNEIDAAVFSGTTFNTHEGRKMLRQYLWRWNKFDKEEFYYAEDGTMLEADGSRSIFDDVDE
jgi:hypothetical protein